MAVVNWLVDSGPDIVGAALTIIGGFAALAVVTPNKHDNLALKIALGAVNLLGANFGNARNAKDA